MSQKSIALIGIGHVAEYQLRALTLDKRWKLVAACDTREAQKALLPPETSFYSDATEMLKNTHVDVVLVATPNQLHYEIGRQVLELRQNLCLEKPCCETSEQMTELVSLAETSGLFFSVALHAAHANDVRWFLAHLEEWSIDLADMSSFECFFSDPYVEQGILLPAAKSLGGSWLDSGINALSVVGMLLPPQELQIHKAQFSKLTASDRHDVDATVSFTFPRQSGTGSGTIKTSWTSGVNRKSTRVGFPKTGHEVLLDHSHESVVLIKDGVTLQTVDLRNAEPRLVNHYSNVFADLYLMLESGASNLTYARAIHEVLFNAQL